MESLQVECSIEEIGYVYIKENENVQFKSVPKDIGCTPPSRFQFILKEHVNHLSVTGRGEDTAADGEDGEWRSWCWVHSRRHCLAHSYRPCELCRVTLRKKF